MAVRDYLQNESNEKEIKTCRRRLGAYEGSRKQKAVLSHSARKRADAMRLGADDFIATGDAGVFEKNAARFDFILDTVSAKHDYNSYLNLLRRDGTMVLVGLPDPAPLSAGPLITRRRSLAGSMIGGIRETQEMLDFCAEQGVASDVEVILSSKSTRPTSAR